MATGFGAGIGMVLVFLASREAHHFAELVERAYRAHGLNDEQAAGYLGITRGQWADQKRCGQHLSAYRLLQFPRPVLVTLYTMYLKDLGLTVIEDAVLGEYLTEGVQHFRKRRQVTMAIDLPRAKESA